VELLGAGGWEEVGAVAAVVAAVAGVFALVATWWYGRSSRSDSRAAVKYERLAEARRLVGEVGSYADNALWARCAEAQAQLRPLLAQLRMDLPECRGVAETSWSLENYSGDEDNPGIQRRVIAAREELERAAQMV
jgi:hypothetical protein